MRNLYTVQGMSERNVNTLPFSDSVFTRKLAAGVAESISVPDAAKFAVFACNDTEFYAQEGGTSPSVPTADSDDGALALNPTIRQLAEGAGRTIYVVSPYACIVQVQFYE